MLVSLVRKVDKLSLETKVDKLNENIKQEIEITKMNQLDAEYINWKDKYTGGNEQTQTLSFIPGNTQEINTPSLS